MIQLQQTNIFLYVQDELVKLVDDMVKKFGKQRFIANLGHGIYPDANPDHVKILIDAIHQY